MKTRFCWGNHCSQSPASPWYKKLGTELQGSGSNLRTQVIRDHVVQYFGKCPVNWCWVPADACLLTISYPHPLHCLFWRYWRSFHWKDFQLLQMCISNNEENDNIKFSKVRLKPCLLEVTIYLYTKYENAIINMYIKVSYEIISRRWMRSQNAYVKK